MSDAAIDTPRVRTSRRRRRLKASFNPASLVGLLVLLVFVAITLYPLVLVVSTAFKNPLDVTLDPGAAPLFGRATQNVQTGGGVCKHAHRRQVVVQRNFLHVDHEHSPPRFASFQADGQRLFDALPLK